MNDRLIHRARRTAVLRRQKGQLTAIKNGSVVVDPPQIRQKTGTSVVFAFVDVLKLLKNTQKVDIFLQQQRGTYFAYLTKVHRTRDVFRVFGFDWFGTLILLKNWHGKRSNAFLNRKREKRNVVMSRYRKACGPCKNLVLEWTSGRTNFEFFFKFKEKKFLLFSPQSMKFSLFHKKPEQTGLKR
jgi:hypothetical protein